LETVSAALADSQENAQEAIAAEVLQKCEVQVKMLLNFFKTQNGSLE